MTGFGLTDQQKAFFDAFGFVRIPGLFAAEVDQISSAFDEAFGAARAATAVADDEVPTGSAHDRLGESYGVTPLVDTYEYLNFGGHRAIIPMFLESTPELSWVLDDPRVTGTARDLAGEGYEYFGSDGNLFDCDTSWHIDAYGAPIERFHVKLLFYLDHLDASSGAMRVLPGTNFHESAFAQGIRPGLFDRARTEEAYGITVEQVPAFTVDNEPGDLIAVNFRTAHATFNSPPGRRLFTLNYRAG